MDYPGKFNNDNKENSEIFKDKVVINQPSGNIEFVNTKDSESVSFNHKNGSFVKLDKFGSDVLTTRDSREHIMGDSLISINGGKTEIVDENLTTVVLGDTNTTIGDANKWKKPMEEIKKSQREIHDVKRLFELRRVSKKDPLDQAPNQTKSGVHALCPTEKNQAKILLTEEPTTVVLEKNSMPRTKLISIQDNVDVYNTVVGAGDRRCLTCWGKLFSPSSQDGAWATESEKQKIVEKREAVQKKIHEYEKQLGQNKHPNGGTDIRIVAKNFIENIGLVFNDFESFRKDPHGKLVPCGVKIDPLGTTIYTQYRDTSLVESVDVEKFPGGSYQLNICDGWTVTVGSNGIEFKTSGPLNLFGSIVNLVGEQVNIGSRGDLGLDGERVDITGEVISIRPKKASRELETGGQTEEEQQVLIDGNLNVNLNAVVRGGLHVEGELTTHHITAPCEYQITETDFVWGNQIPGLRDSSMPTECDEDFAKSVTHATLLPNLRIGYVLIPEIGSLDVYSYQTENFAHVDPHRHYFKNVPLKLFQASSESEVTVPALGSPFPGMPSAHDAVRAIGSRNNWTNPVLPQPVQNSKTENTVLNKFGGGFCSPLTLTKENWAGTESESDSLPIGEGVRTQSSTSAKIAEIKREIDSYLNSKYAELQEAMSKQENSSC